MSNRKKITLPSGSIELHPDGYLKVIMSDYSEIDLEEAKKREAAFFEVSNKIPMPFLIETRSKLIDYSEEARAFFANNSKMDTIRLAEAFIVNNIGIRLFIENYIRKNPQKCPVKIFKNEDDAVEWIQQFID